MEKQINKFIYWTPRILAILFIGFIMLFSFDVFEGQRSFWEYFTGFIMHNIPAIIVAIILFISWRYEIVGAVGFSLVGLVYIYMTFTRPEVVIEHKLIWSAAIALPIILIGILFLIGWFQKNKPKK